DNPPLVGKLCFLASHSQPPQAVTPDERETACVAGRCSGASPVQSLVTSCLHSVPATAARESHGRQRNLSPSHTSNLPSPLDNNEATSSASYRILPVFVSLFASLSRTLFRRVQIPNSPLDAAGVVLAVRYPVQGPAI
ncbi:hypothetical protein BT67DRAFT_410339, partial [Trichocladium antarcticum]